MHLSKEVKIGLIAIIVLAVTVWGYNFLKGKNILKPTDEYYVEFERIDGLIEAGNVMILGYKVGNIAAIDFDQKNFDKFVIKIALEERIKIPVHSVIKIKQINPLASTSDLEILLSDATDYYKSGDTLQSIPNKALSDVLGSLQIKVENVLIGLDSVLLSVNSILTPESRQHFRESITNLDGSLTALNASLSMGGSLYNSFDNFESVTSNLKSKNQKISSTLDHLSNVSAALDSADLKTTLMRLDTAIASARNIIAKIDAGNGTIGKLVNDSSLYANLDSTTYHLSILLDDLQKQPKKYVHFSLFGKKDK
jgi:phospholipid/cholesterol/gamma-HCH transport system substrate-binding protein